MDGVMKQLRVRFSGVGQEDQGGSQTMTMPPKQSTIFGRGQMSKGEEYDAVYAATVAAAAYAIAARGEEKLASQKKPVTIDEPTTAPSLKSPPKRRESLKMPTEGSKVSRWFSGKEPAEDDDDEEEPGANVSIRRPLKPAQKKPEDRIPDQKVIEKVAASASSIKKDPGFAKKSPEKKGSKKFELEQASQKVPPGVRLTTPYPEERKESKKFEQEQGNRKAAPTVRPASLSSNRGNRAGLVASSEADTMADAWEEERLVKIKKQYNETMETIAEWEAEKKAKVRRQKELKESDLERKRAKALEEYNDEMSRISKVAGESRSAAEEKRMNAERKTREKAERIRSTGKLPQSCGCF